MITSEEGESLAREYGMKFFECSALDGSNVEHAFKTLAADTVARLIAQDTVVSPPTKTQKLKGNNEASARTCC